MRCRRIEQQSRFAHSWIGTPLLVKTPHPPYILWQHSCWLEPGVWQHETDTRSLTLTISHRRTRSGTKNSPAFQESNRRHNALPENPSRFIEVSLIRANYNSLRYVMDFITLRDRIPYVTWNFLRREINWFNQIKYRNVNLTWGKISVPKTSETIILSNRWYQ